MPSARDYLDRIVKSRTGPRHFFHHAIQRLVLNQLSPGKADERRVHVDHVDDFEQDAASFDVAGQLTSATVRILTSISRTLWTTPSCSRAAFRLLFVEMVSLFTPDLRSLDAEFLRSKACWNTATREGRH